MSDYIARAIWGAKSRRIRRLRCWELPRSPFWLTGSYRTHHSPFPELPSSLCGAESYRSRHSALRATVLAVISG